MISVIISVHDRKQYMRSAVESVLDQAFPSDGFEIIVVKNFRDQEIDRFLTEKGVVDIYTQEKSLARKMVLGLKKARGDVLCFLDDDDMFSRDKLRIVNEYFRDTNLTFLHDAIIPVDESGKRMERKVNENPERDIILDGDLPLRAVGRALKYKADWYASAISVSKKFFESIQDEFWQIVRGIDKYLFFAALARGSRLIVSSQEVTMYRVHESLTTLDVPLQVFLQQKREFYEGSMESAVFLYSNNGRYQYAEAVRCNMVHAELLANFFSPERKRRKGLLLEGTLCYLAVRNPSIPRWIALSLLKSFSMNEAWKRYYRYYRRTYLNSP